MKFEKTFYVVISTILITAIILVSYISSPIASGYGVSNITKIYYADNITPNHQKLIDMFNKKYEGQIKVIAINLSFDKFSTNERKELLARYLRSKSDRIDIIAVDQIWVPRFAKWCISLGKYIGEEQKRNYLKYALQSCYYKDNLVAIPFYIDIAVMYYRPELLKSLPDYNAIAAKLSKSITWEDFISLHQRLTINNPFYIFPAKDYEGLICQYMEMILGQNEGMFENGNLKINTPEAVKALQLLVDIVNKYNMAPKEVLNFVEDPSYTYYEKNKGVFLRGWQNVNSKLYGNIADIKGLSIVPTPHFQGKNIVSVFGGWNLMLSKYSQRIPESLMFLNFLSSKEAQQILYDNEKLLPANDQLYTDASFTGKHPEVKYFRKLMDNGIHRPALERYTQISDVLSYYIHLAMENKISAREALEKSEQQINSENILLK